jgi:hypothetical protein
MSTFSIHRPIVRRLGLALALTLLVLACAVASRDTGPKVPPQQWNTRRGPVVPHDSFPRDCSLCHAGTKWNEIRADFTFDHAKETGVALEGEHAKAECLRCHNDRGPVAQFAARGCIGCHSDVHRGKLGTSCASCHDAASWGVKAEVARHNRTRFPLVGAHAAVECSRCHPGSEVGNFDRASIQCVDCHGADLARATNPDHAAQGWVTDCQRCHIPTSWGGAGFNHFAFPLTGQHATLACDQCHAGGVFDQAPTQCVGCHDTEYQTTTQPPHMAAGFPTTCDSCHSTSGWTRATFDHSGFPLTGRHAAAQCSACHAGGVYDGLPTTCVACHQSEYNATNDPNHASAGYPTTCQQCHTTVAWTRVNFNHAGVTRDCVQCHLFEYNATTSPNHTSAGYPTSCQQCHSTSTWTGANFDHSGFPLTGQHVSAACNDCHGGGVYKGLPTACVACHQAEFNATSNPNHGSAGYPTSCQQCHTTVAWTRANFNHAGVARNCIQCHQAEYNATSNPNHASNGYPTTCQQCHTTTAWTPANFNHAGVTRNCIQCHQADYAGTTDPNHATAGFPTSCQSCHTTAQWSGATFNHPQFPINNGPHQNLTCAQCHNVPRNFRQFTCTNCHAHLQPQMNNDHDRVNNYTYNSNACYQCHPTGDDD